jgi:hypothetical protein
MFFKTVTISLFMRTRGKWTYVTDAQAEVVWHQSVLVRIKDWFVWRANYWKAMRKITFQGRFKETFTRRDWRLSQS